MKTALLCGAALICAATVASPVFAGGQQQTERIDKTVPIGANATLQLKNFSGKVTVTGTNRSDVSIHAIRRATADRLAHIHLDISPSGSDVTIDANKKDRSWSENNNDDNVVETDFTIEVPSDVNLNLTVFSSSVDVKDVRGSQRIKTFSGEITVDGAWASINAETFSGGITVGLANAAGGHVSFDSFSGSLHSDAPLQVQSSARRRLSGEIGAGTNEYTFKTFSGDVNIK
jgi:DUF4097 and DUF4098 domain-containing protein YvlB